MLSSVANPLVNDPTLDATGADTQSESTTLAFGDTVLVAYNDSGSSAVSSKQGTGWSRSTDGGASFQDMGRLPLDSDASDGTVGDSGDPVLVRDAVSGRVYLITLPNVGSGALGIQVFRSNDSGASFAQPVNAMTGFVAGSGDQLDKPWAAVDNFAGAGQGTLYVAARNYPGLGAGAKPEGIYLSRSIDGGSSFSAPQLLVSTAESQGAFVAVGPDHSVYLFWYDADPSSRLNVRRSTDGGQSFGATVTVANLLVGGEEGDLGLGFRTNAFPQVAVNPATGALYVVYNDNPAGADRADVYLVQSIDQGATWSAPLRVNDDATTNDQFQPGVAVSADGTRLFVSWYDRRLDPANVKMDAFAAIASISGQNLAFGHQLRLSNQSFAPSYGVDQSASPDYRGDYDTATTDGTFFDYSWSDDRDLSLVRNTHQQNVRFAKIPITGAAGPTAYISRPDFSMSAVSSVSFEFDQPMDPASFALSDVASFTDPHGNDLRGALTGFSWVDPRTLAVSFLPQAIQGTYTIALGPAITAASAGGAAMDQNVNGVAGESTGDQYIGTFDLLTQLGPDAFHYTARPAAFEDIDLVEGAPGVVKLIDNQDDGAAAIPLGSDTFNFYGTSYSGSSSLFVSSNGLITLGSGNSSFLNTDLTGSPSQAAIAVVWDDWMTNFNGASNANSCVLYQFDAANHRLIIEWNDVVNQIGGADSATFQAILQLDTGPAAGDVVLNFPNLVVRDPHLDDGADATIGIKAAGAQPASGGNRLLVSLNDGQNPFVASGKAVVLHRDVTPPALAAAAAFQYLTGPQSISLPFSENVADSLTREDVTIENLTTGVTIPSSALNLIYNSATNDATLTFPGLTRGTLADGDYRLTLASAGIADASANALDGDNNGTPGGDYSFEFFFLNADANHDRKVDTLDFNALAANFGGSGKNYAQADFNYDGVVDTLDFNTLAAQFGKSLPAPRAITGIDSSTATLKQFAATPFSANPINFDNVRRETLEGLFADSREAAQPLA